MEKPQKVNQSEDEEEYSEYSTTSSSNNDTFFLNHVKTSTDGNIFFIKCAVVPTTTNRVDAFPSADDHELFRKEYKRMSMRGGASTVFRLGGAKKIKEKNFYGIKVLKKHRVEESDRSIKEVSLTLNGKKVRNLTGVKILETVFGIVPSISLAKRLVIAQVKENCPFAKDGFVKPGDIIKTIAGDLVNSENLDMCLRNLDSLTTLKLVFHEMMESSALNAVTIKITALGDILENLHLIYNYDRPVIENEESSFSLIFLAKDAEGGMIPKFCFPKKEKNVLYGIRGSFLTIDAILESNFQENPSVTIFKYNRNLFYVSYCAVNGGLMLLGYNQKYCTPFEVKQRTQNFLAMLELIYSNIDDPFVMTDLPQICELQRVQLITAKKAPGVAHFEQCLPQPPFTTLPKEIQLRIDDAISELEALDFCNWTDSEDVIDSLREFIIVGCSLYFRNTLVTTHLSSIYMQEIQNCIEHFGLKKIMEVTTVKKMIVWHRIYTKDEPVNDKKKFVVFTSQGNLMMASVMEEQVARKGGPNRPTILKTSLAYYVEEMQDILEYFRLTGVENLTRIWISSNKRPEVLTSVQTTQEVTNSVKDEESDSDSDWDEGPNSGQSSSGFDMSDCSDIMYKDFQEIIPSILTIGPENLLYHFVQIEFGSGLIISPSLQQPSCIVNTFRKVSCHIHEIFLKTIKFEQLLATKQSPSLAAHHRSLVPIKEHGVKMRIGKDNIFWVIGRLFNAPKRELYVCHRSDMPQNMVELSFKICISGAG